MYDDRCLIDLINKRFDDTNAQITALKADMLREVQALKAKHDEHEEHDTERFALITTKLEAFEKIKWTVMGAASVAFAIIQAASKAVEHFLN